MFKAKYLAKSREYTKYLDNMRIYKNEKGNIVLDGEN